VSWRDFFPSRRSCKTIFATCTWERISEGKNNGIPPSLSSVGKRTNIEFSLPLSTQRVFRRAGPFVVVRFRAEDELSSLLSRDFLGAQSLRGNLGPRPIWRRRYWSPRRLREAGRASEGRKTPGAKVEAFNGEGLAKIGRQFCFICLSQSKRTSISIFPFAWKCCDC